MTIAHDLLQVIEEHPSSDIHTKWRFDSVGQVMTALLKQVPKLADITPDEIYRVMNILASDLSDVSSRNVDIGGDASNRLFIGGRDIRYQAKQWLSSAKIPGLFAHGKMPPDETAHQKAALEINGILSSMGYTLQVIAAEQNDTRSIQDFSRTVLTVRTPERPGVYKLYGDYSHAPDNERRDESDHLAKVIAGRIEHRNQVQQARLEVEEDIARRIADIDGMQVVGSKFAIDTWKISRFGEGFQGSAYAKVEVVDDTLRKKIVQTAVRNDSGTHFKNIVSRHRSNYRQLGLQSVKEAQQCDPVLAAAIRAVSGKHGKGLLKEIEAAVAGISMNPTNPRLRGISNLSFHRGALTAAVTLGKGVRYNKNRIVAGSIKKLPETLLQSFPGRDARQVIDHPYLEGLKIRKSSINADGLNIRLEPSPIPLTTILAELKAVVKKDNP